MNKKLLVQLIIRPDCKLIAVDNTDYYNFDINLLQYMIVDFIVFKDDLVQSSIKVRKELHNRGQYLSRFASEFLLEKDGTYTYYKLIIPTLDFFKIDSEDSDLYHNLQGQLFFLDGKLYHSLLENNDKCNLEAILDNSEEITDYLKAYDIVQNNDASQTFYSPAKNIFSVCKLQRCLANLQKQLLFESCNKCEETATLRKQRDLLLSAMYVFDYLKDLGNFTEAQRILDNLSSCNFVCQDNDFNDCGCGSSI